MIRRWPAVVAAIPTAVTAPSLFLTSLDVWESAIRVNAERYVFLAIGAGAYALIRLTVVRGPHTIWETFSHELAHALVSTILLVRVNRFKADRDPDSKGVLGFVVHEKAGGFRRLIISLCPYFLPIYSLGIVVVIAFVSPAARPVFEILLGASFAAFVVSVIRDCRPHQSDIRNNGTLLSMWLVVFANVVVVTSMLLVFLGGWSDVGLFFRAWLAGVFQSVRWGAEMLVGAVGGLRR